ncbi:hypothetical protein CVT25_002980, partial [Psilocybe cyanescens]
ISTTTTTTTNLTPPSPGDTAESINFASSLSASTMAAHPPPLASGPQQSSPMQTDTSGSSTQLSWEGDKMFNIYIYDYCFKRGFRNTARELMAEAEIVSDPTPPINARQGLLFECAPILFFLPPLSSPLPWKTNLFLYLFFTFRWWSVFWVLFQAKSNGGGNDDGLVYINVSIPPCYRSDYHQLDF